MPELSTAALEAIAAAVCSGARSWQHHGDTLDAAESAARLLAQASWEGDELVIAFAPDRIAVGATIVTEHSEVVSQLGSMLRAHGLRTVRARRGVEPADVVRFARELRQPPDVTGPRSLGPARLRAGVRPDEECDATHDGAPLARLCGPLARLHANVLLASALKGAELEGVAESVLRTVTDRSEPMLRLVEIQNHDQYLMAHTVNVSALVGALSRDVGISEADTERAVIAAMLHDIGKREIPSSILLKSGPLSDEERRVVLTHPAVGAKLLLERDDLPLLASVVAYEHHRRLDRRGYPEPASAATPTLVSQIVQIADIFDALRSDRPYRNGKPVDNVLEIMSNEAGKAYDRALFEVFVDRVLTRISRGRFREGDNRAA